MRFRTTFTCIFLASQMGASAISADRFCFSCLDTCVPSCIARYCCDDYCPKKEACACAPLKFCCDDYCMKKEPCVCVPLKWCCDDYSSKCLPKIYCPPRCEQLKCGPHVQTACGDTTQVSCDHYADASAPQLGQPKSDARADSSLRAKLRQVSVRLPVVHTEQ